MKKIIAILVFLILTYSSVLSAATISADSNYGIQENLYFSYSGLSGGNDWVSIYTSSGKYVTWNWVVDPNGITFSGLAEGSYEVRLHFHGTTKIEATDTFTVSDSVTSGGTIPETDYGVGQVNSDIWVEGNLAAIYPVTENSVVIHIVGTHETECTNNGDNPFYNIRVGENNVTEKAYKSLYAAVLTAYAMDSKVTFNYDASTAGCYISSLAILK